MLSNVLRRLFRRLRKTARTGARVVHPATNPFCDSPRRGGAPPTGISISVSSERFAVPKKGGQGRWPPALNIGKRKESDQLTRSPLDADARMPPRTPKAIHAVTRNPPKYPPAIAHTIRTWTI